MTHILAAEQIWAERLLGRENTITAWPTVEVAAWDAWVERNAAAYADVIESLSVDQAVDYRTFTGEQFRSTVGDLLLHVLSHGSYHRGQVAMLVAAAAGTPASTDYVVFANTVAKDDL